ncbi:MAG: 16S rRNA (adenine(1518)-N(6)/adenine(1519)-N(6))-dimethyltransferase RsmA [Oscillospiraceae bacterium]|nr:16S rRNA (adenine(1518)-N(6)/adenine(1519)-N(6))-dimethyltransferase RsmA [Oscillospiraceae bacterium]
MSNLIQIKEILEKYNKIPKRSLGQNFLINPEIAKKTAEICMGGVFPPVDGVLEIGPGIGALTVELCRLYKKVAAVEIDRTFEPILNDIMANYSNLNIIFDDILRVDLHNLVKNEFSECEKIYVCANLPYYITTPVILKLLKSGVRFNGITVMVQKEAADRLCSKAGEANYNATATVINYYGEAKKMFNVPKLDFYPAPKILSTVVRIIPHNAPIANPKSEGLMYKIIDAAFEQRRKTLVNALVNSMNLDKEKVINIVKKITGNESIRGEELNVRMFADISDLIYDLQIINK